MPRNFYDLTRAFIIDTLSANKEVSLHDLLEIGNKGLRVLPPEDISWFILKVKIDLEARKVLRVKKGIGPQRTQIISLRKSINS
jgi:hypothetical protein